MVEEQEIVHIAKTRSNELISTAESKSRELRRVANEYVDDALRRTEEAVSAALDEVRQSRVRFRSAAGARSVQQTIQTLSDEALESDANGSRNKFSSRFRLYVEPYRHIADS
jgi:ribosomal protein L17